MIQTFLENISIKDIIDIFIVAILLYLIFLGFKKTKSIFVLAGIIITGSLYLVANILGLRLLAALMQGFFAIILIAIVIIFQEEIKKLFEYVALFSLAPKSQKARLSFPFQSQLDILADTLFFLAEKHIGAIIVLKGKDLLLRNIQRGINLNGQLSAPLLKSIFDTHSDGHDGAVIIEGDKILQFACHLPLSKDSGQLKNKGTRHAAALGLSEITDALCIAVSETSGEISVCQNGKLKLIKDKKTFYESLKKFHKSIGNTQEKQSKEKFFTRRLFPKLAIILLSVFLWWFFVNESIVIYKSFEVPIQHISLVDDLHIEGIFPQKVKVVLSAPRRNFYFVDQKDIEILAKIIDVENLVKITEGFYELTLTASDITLPGSYTIVNIFPRNIRVNINQQ